MLVINSTKKKQAVEKVDAHLCYRGVHYDKTCVLNSMPILSPLVR